MRYHIVKKSGNAKTGPIPVTTTTSDSCDPKCGLYKTCYAKGGKLAIHWRKVDAGERGGSLDALCAEIKALPDGQLWRHNQAGDLPGKGRRIAPKLLAKIVEANRGKRGFTYTHKRLTKANVAAIKAANDGGFTVNISADTMADVDKAKALGIAPVVTVLPKTQRENTDTPAGHKVVICPAEVRDNVTCQTCGLCAWKERDVVIGFPAHGSRANQIVGARPDGFVPLNSIALAKAA